MDLAFDIDYGDIPGADLRDPKENLEATARSTLNLANLLVSDLGFDYSDLDITFSGKKGFHIRVKLEGHPLFSDSAQQDESVRRALISYVSGNDFSPMDFILVRAHAQGANSWHLKGFESGWGKRFNESVEYLLKAATSGHFEKDSRNLFSMVHRQKAIWHKKIPSINKGDRRGLGLSVTNTDSRL